MASEPRPAPPPDLGRVQRWMQAVVCNLAPVEQAVRARAAHREVAAGEVSRLIVPSPTLTSIERVGVYHGMYFLRMRDALAYDFPVVKHFLGEDGFDDLVRRYIEVHPSRSYTLNRLGTALPGFVHAASGLKRHRALHDLALLELTLSEVFDVPSSPPLSAEEVAAVPASAWEGARLVPIESLRLLPLGYPVNEYLQAVKDEEQPPALVPRKSFVAVYRPHFVVYRRSLTPAGHDLLARLVRGTPLGRAVAQARARHARGLGEEQVFSLFRDWVGDGMFRAVAWTKGRQRPATKSSTRRRKLGGSIAG